MQVSKKKVNKNLNLQIHRLFYQVLSDLKNPLEIESFFKDFLTKTELEVLTKRLAAAYFLSKGRRYQEIKKDLALSSTTVATVSRQIKKHGFIIALKKIKADEWAEKWAEKLTHIMKFTRRR